MLASFLQLILYLHFISAGISCHDKKTKTAHERQHAFAIAKHDHIRHKQAQQTNCG